MGQPRQIVANKNSRSREPVHCTTTTWRKQRFWPLLRMVLAKTIESTSTESSNMSSIGRRTAECPEFESESSTFELHNSGPLTLPIDESEDFAELVKKLTKSNWFCEVAEA